MADNPYLQWPLFRRSVVAAFERSLTSETPWSSHCFRFDGLCEERHPQKASRMSFWPTDVTCSEQVHRPPARHPDNPHSRQDSADQIATETTASRGREYTPRVSASPPAGPL